MSNRSGGCVGPQHEPDIQIIKLHKSNNGMGLSIVAAKVSFKFNLILLFPVTHM